MRLRVGHQDLQYWHILARFVEYYSLFWDPGVTSTINELKGVFTCRSSMLAVFVDSDPIRRLLITVLGPKAISMVVDHQGVFTCWSSRLVVWADSRPFHELLLSFGVPK